MYSLYRAWFGDSVAGDSYSRLQETLSPPDTVVRVGNEGEHQFIAHKGVLAAHSGYLKALLSSTAASTNASGNATVGSCSNLPATAIAVATTNLSGQSPRPVTSVSVSSIGGEAFAPLLNYMYTGRLEVTLDNVYSVLLATHLLHMPGALEQCRAALLRLRAPPPLPTPIPVPVPVAPTSTLTSTSMSMSTSTPGAGNILRPIPNRLMIEPSMCWSTTPLYPPTAPPPAPASIGLSHLPRLQPSVLMQSTVPLNVSVVPTSVCQDTRYSDVPSPKPSPYQLDRNRGPSRDCRQKPPENVARSFAAAAAFTAFACSSATRPVSPSRSVSPAPSSESQSSIPSNRSKKSSSESSDQRQIKEERGDEQSKSGQRRGSSPLLSVDEGAAARNRTNETSSTDTDRGNKSSKKKRGGSSSGNGNESSSGVLSVVYDVACCDGPIKFHRVLNENYSSTATCGSSAVSQARLQRCFEAENASRENDENGGPAGNGCDPIAMAIDTDAGNTGGSYTCGYCRHTFKSQYCYRKHTKRHLLPTRLNESAVSAGQRQEVQRNRREVRLLDLNVQYYPCKICGCKFPSYYFVHKHRKLCHANADERPQTEEVSGTGEDRESTIASNNEAVNVDENKKFYSPGRG